jgi:hypothetical protein
VSPGGGIRDSAMLLASSSSPFRAVAVAAATVEVGAGPYGTSASGQGQREGQGVVGDHDGGSAAFLQSSKPVITSSARMFRAKRHQHREHHLKRYPTVSGPSDGRLSTPAASPFMGLGPDRSSVAGGAGGGTRRGDGTGEAGTFFRFPSPLAGQAQAQAQRETLSSSGWGWGLTGGDGGAGGASAPAGAQLPAASVPQQTPVGVRPSASFNRGWVTQS